MTSRPSNQIPPELGSVSRRMQRPVVDLPQPELADEAQGLAGGDREADMVDRVHLLGLGE